MTLMDQHEEAINPEGQPEQDKDRWDVQELEDGTHKLTIGNRSYRVAPDEAVIFIGSKSEAPQIKRRGGEVVDFHVWLKEEAVALRQIPLDFNTISSINWDSIDIDEVEVKQDGKKVKQLWRNGRALRQEEVDILHTIKFLRSLIEPSSPAGKKNGGTAMSPAEIFDVRLDSTLSLIRSLARLQEHHDPLAAMSAPLDSRQKPLSHQAFNREAGRDSSFEYDPAVDPRLLEYPWTPDRQVHRALAHQLLGTWYKDMHEKNIIPE